MKKIILSTLLVSTITLVGIQSASAATVKEAETPVGIEFESETPWVPGPYKGVLTMVQKPSAINFGKVKATGGQMIAPATNLKDENNKQFLIVNDDRENKDPVDAKPENADNIKGGTWKLTAKMDEMTAGDKIFAGTKLNLTFKDAQGYDIGTKPLKLPSGVEDIDPKDPNTDNTALFPLPTTEDINLNKELTLVAGGASAVIMSKETASGAKAGVATQLSAANLVIQSDKNVSGQATSKITWTLGTGLK